MKVTLSVSNAEVLAMCIAWSSAATPSRSRQCAVAGRPIEACAEGDDLDVEVTDTIAAESGPAVRPPCPPICSSTSCASFRKARRSFWNRPATAPRSRSAPAARASPADAAGKRLSGPRAWRDDTQFTLKAADLKRLIDKTSSLFRPKRPLTTSTASICTPRVPPRRRRCAQSQPMAIGWRRWSLTAQGRHRHAGHHRAAQNRQRVQRLMEDSEAEVLIELSPARSASPSTRAILTSKLIDGTFPDYARVIPVRQ